MNRLTYELINRPTEEPFNLVRILNFRMNDTRDDKFIHPIKLWDE